jgi:mono/diheme cytochrome c family protein
MFRLLLALLALCCSLAAQRAPRIWDEKAMQDWATPIAALKVRPGHFSAEEYYKVPPFNYKTYPVYHPEREPAGFWQMLQKAKPEPALDITRIRTEADWIQEGKEIFRTLVNPLFISREPKDIAIARDPANFATMLFDENGEAFGFRWVVTEEGVGIAGLECAGCHFREEGGKFRFAGPAAKASPQLRISDIRGLNLLGLAFSRLFSGDSPGVAFWRNWTTPWDPDERVEQFRTKPFGQLARFLEGGLGSDGVFARINGSLWHQTKIPDLQNLKYQRYIDATGTHRMRGPEDIARYAAVVSGVDSLDFGQYRILTDQQRRVPFRYADELLYAIGVYLWNLEPPSNPHPAPKAQVERGRKIFVRETCAGCHAPPNYTTWKLTLALGYEPPLDHPNQPDIQHVSVGTDPGLALKTRKGTGFYKIPSLRGLWYRPLLLHDGSLASLEEMFDPARLKPDFEPQGWNPPDVKQRAVTGHPFGLALKPAEKADLLAFLRSI